MKRMYVDDLRNAPPGWTLVRTITDAISLLRITEWDCVSCDHDICHTVPKLADGEILPIPTGVIALQDHHRAYQINSKGIDIPVTCPENYSAVVMYIADMPEKIRPKVSCHSANPEAYKKFASILNSVGDRLYPFDELNNEKINAD